MAFLGADTEALRAYAERMSTGAVQIEDLAVRLGSAVDSVVWVGPDADAFREEWASRVRSLIESSLDELRRRAQELERDAEEQDETSGAGGDGSGSGVGRSAPGDDRSPGEMISDWLEDYEPLESDGFWGDLLGDNGIIGLDSWAAVSSAIDVVGMFDVGTWGDVLNIAGDAASMGIAVYDGMQAFQDGDLFGTLDAGITYGINSLDLAVTTVGMIPHPITKGIGLIGGPITGALDIGWNGLTVATAHNPDSVGGGSPSRALLETPGYAVESLTGWSGLREGTDTVLDGAQDFFHSGSETVRDAVPIIDPMIDTPQRIVEGVGGLFD